MPVSTVVRFSDLIRQDRDLILRQWITEVMRVPGAKELDRPTLIDHMPQLIDDIWHGLRKQEDLDIANGNGNGTSEAHGVLRLHAGFDLVEVVAEYNVLREVLLEFAHTQSVSLDGHAGRLVHRTIDRAIAFAVRAYSEERTIEIQRRREEHLSFIVHDLKTPIAAIETSMLIFNSKYRVPDAPATRFLDIVSRNARRLHALVSTVLQEQQNLQRGFTSLEKREFDLWPLLQALAQDFEPLADSAHTEIRNNVPEDLSIYADAQAISRVFQNLLSNAIKHTRDGRISISGQRTGDRVELWVEDTGDGIATERFDKIFHKLETDGTDQGALGLGLAIVREIVEAHGGTVSVESRLGQGSKFTFVLPDATTP